MLLRATHRQKEGKATRYRAVQAKKNNNTSMQQQTYPFRALAFVLVPAANEVDAMDDGSTNATLDLLTKSSNPNK